jgi:PhnB protein
MTTKPIPPGYHSVTPYLVVRDPGSVIDFAKQAFGATERMRHTDQKGRVVHAEITIGDSVVMIGESSEQHPSMPSTLHLYLSDSDAAYRQAMAAGATSVREPTTEFYGDRMAGVRDSEGNNWWLATHVEDVSPEEMQRRAAQQV